MIREASDEAMVALTPSGVKRLLAMGIEATVESQAGLQAGFTDEEYRSAGAKVLAPAREILAMSDIVVTVNGIHGLDDWKSARPGTLLIGLLKPLTADIEMMSQIAQWGITAISLDALPRISRAQSMDVLSALSTVMGYRAVIIAAERLRKFFPLLMTAAGTIPPSRVLVLGAGVAGLQAIATARRLGAVVEAFDTRPEVKEQVESLGAQFLTIDVHSEHTVDGYATGLQEQEGTAEQERLFEPVQRADAVITTAQIPGSRAPLLITNDMIRRMKPGSVIVDIAAETGGNTEATVMGREVEFGGVRIVGTYKLASEIPSDASQLYSRNLTTFLQYLQEVPLSWTGDHQLQISLADQLLERMVIIHQGQVLHQELKRRIDEGGTNRVRNR